MKTVPIILLCLLVSMTVYPQDAGKKRGNNSGIANTTTTRHSKFEFEYKAKLKEKEKKEKRARERRRREEAKKRHLADSVAPEVPKAHEPSKTDTVKSQTEKPGSRSKPRSQVGQEVTDSDKREKHSSGC